jgi:uncharacterized repeat protein (TIGR03803 family)
VYKSNWFKRACSIFLLCAATVVVSPAQTLKTLVSFDETNGEAPNGPLVQATNGDFYGTTVAGGVNMNSACIGEDGSCGTVFKVTPAGNLTTLYSFCSQTNCADGATPLAGLVQGTNGNFYGTTLEGGINNQGTVFEITPTGRFTTLYKFCSQANCADGSRPYAPLVEGTNGHFYSTTSGGGANGQGGTVFEITTKGKLTTLYSFCLQQYCADGGISYAGLTQSINGNFYGTTESGGTGYSEYCQLNCGTVFKITPKGKLTTIYSFCSEADCADGASPIAGLVQGSNGNFYGTTDAGGNFEGTVFEITSIGELTTLYRFCPQNNCSNGGAFPDGVLVRGSDENFYGITEEGGLFVGGTIFEVSPSGTLTTLYNFCALNACGDGAAPLALVQATNGKFYGVTNGGGANNSNLGTVFSLSVGLEPFVETRPTTGKVAKKVEILGQGFKGATTVSFNGTAATFEVVSGTHIVTTVPSGATTGPVTVTTPRGTLTSNVDFRVTPQITNFTPKHGPPGAVVIIRGVSLTQTTKVTFGGVNAAFVVNSDSKLTATVPKHAKTGRIKITTAGGISDSKSVFTVTE